MNTDELIQILKNTEPNGLQVSSRKGCLNFTRAIFHKKNKIFILDFDEIWNFDVKIGNEIYDFKTQYKNSIWVIEDVIF